ncbi:hypothetical protein K523DRAFT_422352 [Schizophyllum commune Tattone D]|nr:hypothetical protein K523DRAFT_422352 [Schizophyllum commune Tattone D]
MIPTARYTYWTDDRRRPLSLRQRTSRASRAGLLSRPRCCEDALVSNVARSAIIDIVAPCDGAHDVAHCVNEQGMGARVLAQHPLRQRAGCAAQC